MADKKEEKEVKKPSKKRYLASVTKRVGSQKDGKPKYNFKQGEPIELTAVEAKKLRKYIK